MPINMGYCRFENTLAALRECYDHAVDEDLGEHEAKARNSLLLLCDSIAQDFEDEIDFIREARKAARKT